MLYGKLTLKLLIYVAENSSAKKAAVESNSGAH